MPSKFEGFQGQTYGLSFWLPFYGGALTLLGSLTDTGACICRVLACSPRRSPTAKKAYDEFRTVAPHMIEGDYYPLTPYNRATDQWIAWQFHTPETSGGVIQAFRRARSRERNGHRKTARPRCQRDYEIENLDGGKEVRTGAELMRGLDITLREKPAAAVLVLKTIK